ncbi:MAG: glycosyltransferase family 4 protein [Candidatus Woesearchaeota archaeon]|nr:glycosyltransferase family 4 protein [Candidatus Woesearchaeota archaeon]
MKILMLAQNFIRFRDDIMSPFLFNWVSEINKNKDFEVIVLAPHEKGLKEYEVIGGVKIYRFRYASDKYERIAYKNNMHELVIKNTFNKLIFLKLIRNFYKKIIEIVQKEKIDIIHANWWVPCGIAAYLAFKKTKVPYIVTTHGTDVFILRKFKFFSFFARKIFKNAAKVNAVSNYVAKIVTDLLKINKNKIAVFPMPFDRNKFYPVKKGRNKIKTIFTMGKLVKRKGVNYLVDACSILKDKKIDFKLIIVGKGPEEESLKEQIKNLNLEKNITIIPSVPHKELVKYYNDADVFVLASITDWKGETEAFGVVFAEALACKTPVIGTRTGGIPDVVIDGKTGILVEEKNPKQLADALIKILKNEKLAKKLAENGYKYVHENFTAEKIAGKTIKVYNEVVSR